MMTYHQRVGKILQDNTNLTDDQWRAQGHKCAIVAQIFLHYFSYWLMFIRINEMQRYEDYFALLSFMI